MAPGFNNRAETCRAHRRHSEALHPKRGYVWSFGHTSVVIETSVMNKTYDPDSIRVPGFDPEFRVPGLVFVAGGGGRFKLSGFFAPVPLHTSRPQDTGPPRPCPQPPRASDPGPCHRSGQPSLIVRHLVAKDMEGCMPPLVCRAMSASIAASITTSCSIRQFMLTWFGRWAAVRPWEICHRTFRPL